MEGISNSAWETAATVKYAGHREVERVQAPYDLKQTQSWTSFKEPADLEYKKNSSPYTLLTGLSSQWNADGQMVVRERAHDEAGGYEWGEVFRYDRMGRLTKMWYDVRNPSGFSSTDPVEGTNPYDLRKSWNLGKVYERDSVVVKEYNQTASTTTYSVNDHYQVTAGPGAMTWNDNGYMTDRAADDFSWTALGQLEQAAIAGGSTLDYTYDAFGRRVKTVNGSQVNRFLYHGWHMIGEWDDTAEEWLWQEAPWNSGERMLEHIALDTNDLDTDENVSEYRQYAVHEDFQDTVWGLSGTNAAIAERYNYTDPYGQSDSEDGAASALGDFATQVFHRRRLHGGIVESGSELYDFRNRWKLASESSWTSPEPLQLIESFNRYQYVRCDPIYLTDVNGLESKSPLGANRLNCSNGVSCDARIGIDATVTNKRSGKMEKRERFLATHQSRWFFLAFKTTNGTCSHGECRPCTYELNSMDFYNFGEYGQDLEKGQITLADGQVTGTTGAYDRGYYPPTVSHDLSLISFNPALPEGEMRVVCDSSASVSFTFNLGQELIFELKLIFVCDKIEPECACICDGGN